MYKNMMKCDGNNYLNVNFSEIFGYSCEVVISPWSKGISWSTKHENITNRHLWHEEPGIPLGVLLHDKAACRWVSEIPETGH